MKQSYDDRGETVKYRPAVLLLVRFIQNCVIVEAFEAHLLLHSQNSGQIFLPLSFWLCLWIHWSSFKHFEAFCPLLGLYCWRY